MGANGFAGAEGVEVDGDEVEVAGTVAAAETGSAAAGSSLIDKSFICSTGSATEATAAAVVVGVSAGFGARTTAGVGAAGTGVAAVGATPFVVAALFFGSKLMVGTSAVSPAQNLAASSAATPALVSGNNSA